ncbi:ribonuclease T2 [Roridomyces roridus]|uniref:ribonuclease T2 n=1 Tax=Roridomyces roridus TaxID=1738132 RepID=A0AAD7BYY4_9AGAR|nr:ribonuclease T2 [Roridomyces roridus]
MLFDLAFLMGLTSMVPKFVPDAHQGQSQAIIAPPTQYTQMQTQCGASGIASCQNTSVVENLCCFEAPGGLLLQTQFWDTSPATGPSESWTIHGLWPDKCDLTYVENCDSSRAYTDIAGLLTDQGASDTLEFMQQYWVNDPDDGSDEEFWEHEWETHGTCYSTLQPSCLPDGSPTGAEAVVFFNTVVKLFQTLPTYTWLANHEIIPSSSATHNLDSLISALQAESGYIPALDCKGTTMDSVSWYFNLQGSLVDGTFVPIDAPKKGNCRSSGIRYLPKGAAE